MPHVPARDTDRASLAELLRDVANRVQHGSDPAKNNSAGTTLTRPIPKVLRGTSLTLPLGNQGFASVDGWGISQGGALALISKRPGQPEAVHKLITGIRVNPLHSCPSPHAVRNVGPWRADARLRPPVFPDGSVEPMCWSESLTGEATRVHVSWGGQEPLTFPRAGHHRALPVLAGVTPGPSLDGTAFVLATLRTTDKEWIVERRVGESPREALNGHPDQIWRTKRRTPSGYFILVKLIRLHKGYPIIHVTRHDKSVEIHYRSQHVRLSKKAGEHLKHVRITSDGTPECLVDYGDRYRVFRPRGRPVDSGAGRVFAGYAYNAEPAREGCLVWNTWANKAFFFLPDLGDPACIQQILPLEHGQALAIYKDASSKIRIVRVTGYNPSPKTTPPNHTRWNLPKELGDCRNVLAKNLGGGHILFWSPDSHLVVPAHAHHYGQLTTFDIFHRPKEDGTGLPVTVTHPDGTRALYGVIKDGANLHVLHHPLPLLE